MSRDTPLRIPTSVFPLPPRQDRASAGAELRMPAQIYANDPFTQDPFDTRPWVIAPRTEDLADEPLDDWDADED